MFPAAIDRDRLLEKVLRMARRHRHRLGQAVLARRAGVSQATISNLETIATARQDGRRWVRRDIFLRVLLRGLALDQECIDTLLWLYDGTPLTADEIARCVHLYLPQAHRKHYTAAEFRQQVLALLIETHQALTAPEARPPASVDVVFVTDEVSRIRALQTILHMESLPGQRLVVQKYPSFLGYPHATYHSETFMPPAITSTAGRQAIRALHAQRCETFLHHLELYGERSIHHRTSLERYAHQHILHYLSLRQRRQHLRHWITLLESYKHYEVGLANTLPTLELRLKSTVQAMLRGTPSYDRSARGVSRGPQYLHWFDEGSVLTFYLDFEQHWDTIPLEYRTKSSVIAWLQRLLDS
jgi:transcriptional regulator with XRE-family HTH domain